jgi:hypothetical protein
MMCSCTKEAIIAALSEYSDIIFSSVPTRFEEAGVKYILIKKKNSERKILDRNTNGSSIYRKHTLHVLVSHSLTHTCSCLKFFLTCCLSSMLNARAASVVFPANSGSTRVLAILWWSFPCPEILLLNEPKIKQ